MSVHNIVEELERKKFVVSVATASLPAASATGYPAGAEVRDTTTGAVYINTGDESAAVWTKVDAIQSTVTGTDLVDSAGAFVDYAETITIDASTLVAGDIIKIGGLLVIDDYNGADTLDFKVFASAVTLLHTGDMSLVNDNDYLRFDITVRVRTAGSSGKIIWDALAHTNIAGTLALKNCTVEDGVSLAGTTLDMSGDVIIKASGDYSAAHADNESQVLWNVQILRKTV